MIFHYKDEPNGVYFVIRGCVELLGPNIKGGSFDVVKSLRAGSYFGEIATLLNTTRSLTA